MIGSVSALWRYPASSLGGERLDDIVIGLRGVKGDRLYGIVDAETGDIARPDGRDPRWPKVVQIRARLAPDGGLEIAIPGSRWHGAPGERADAAASNFLGFAVSIRPLGGEAADDGISPVAQARYVKAPVHLITTASMQRLKALHPAGDPDQRRFRPNIVVDMAEVEGHFPETEWIGRRLAIGDVELGIAEPCRRCGFTMQAQEGLGHDPQILRQLVRHNAHNIGVYCTVEKPGRVVRGDGMRLI
ncbi:MAG: MOSC domain-containing protein [Nitratireductor sp.]|nr:MOSC domain-containing protein [Nitratireductor sp.]